MFAGWSVGSVLCLGGFRAPPISFQSHWIAKVYKPRKPDSNESKWWIQDFPYFPLKGKIGV